MSDPMTRARAAREYIDSQGGRRDGLVNAIGAELFGNAALQRLVTCSICGLLGDEGDLCGRAPEGHTLAPIQPPGGWFSSTARRRN